jgi:hypothetical protein
MGIPKRDPPYKQPFTPLATDVFVRETHNVVRPVNDPIPEFGTPHDAISKAESWPHHRFCWQTEINPQGDCERWFVATPESQHLYNWQYSDSPDWPVIRQVFVVERELFDPTFTAYAAPPSDILDLTNYAVTAIEQIRIGEKQLDTLFVSVQVTREKITNNPKIGSVLDPQTNTLRQVLIEKVPAGTAGTTVDTNGQYSEVQPINTLWALKTTQFMAGLAGSGDGAQQTWNDVLNYSWPDVLLGFNFFSFPSSSGSVDSVTGLPIWKRQRYDGPCEATITETWTLNPPTPPSFTTMQPREIEYRSPLMSVSTPPCLHPKVILWDTPGANHPSLGFYVYSQTYEATSLTDWPATYVASFTVRPAAGGYLSRLVEVKRPDGRVYDNILELNSPTPGTALNSVDISWALLNQNGTLSGYRLDVNTKADFTGTFLKGFNNRNVGTATSHTITGMTPATQYFVRVRATLTSPTASVTSNTQLAVAQPVIAYTVTESATPIVDGGTLAFGNFTEGGSAIVKTITVTNTGNVTITGLTRTLTDPATPDQWTAGAFSGTTVAAGATRTFTLTFQATSAGAKTASVAISADNISATSFNLTGTGVAVPPVLSVLVDGSGVSNGGGSSFSASVSPDSKSITIDNLSAWSTVAISSITMNNDAPGTAFALSGTLPTSVAPGGTTAPFDVTFDNTGSLPWTGTLSIVHDGTPTPYNISFDAV